MGFWANKLGTWKVLFAGLQSGYFKQSKIQHGWQMYPVWAVNHKHFDRSWYKKSEVLFYTKTKRGIIIVIIFLQFLVFPLFKGVLHHWALFLKTLCIFSKNKATLDKVSCGAGQKCSKELKNHSFTSIKSLL